MSTFKGISPFSNPLWVAMETMHCHIAHAKSIRIQGVPINNLAPIKIVLGCKITSIGFRVILKPTSFPKPVEKRGNYTMDDLSCAELESFVKGSPMNSDNF